MKFFCKHWMNSLYNIHWEENCARSFKKTKKGGNCFSQIITLVCRRTNRKLVLELLFKTFLFLNKQLHKALEGLKCLDFLGEQVKEPRFRVFLEGKKLKKGPAAPSV